MRFRFDDEQLQFAAALRDMLAREFTATDLRAVWEDGTGHAPELWGRLAEMGVLSMMWPESDGGMGGTMIDAVLLVEELGRAAVPGPILETMTVGAVVLGGSRWAADAAAGELTVTAALLDEPLLPHRTADVAVLAHAGSLAVHERPGDVLGAVEGLDGGRLLGEWPDDGMGGDSLTFVSEAGELLGDSLQCAVAVGTTATAAYLLGLSKQMIDIAGEYARARRQFGQPIGSFQAVKHLMANALIGVEFARPAVYYAAWSVATDQPTRARDVSMAKCLATEAAQLTARAALQVHGAIGYTWECDLHLFMKKAWALAPAWGSAMHHRRVVAAELLEHRSPGSSPFARGT